MSAVAGAIELALGGRGPRRAFVFDAHRWALSCWAEAADGRPALLVTLDRHFDLVPPLAPLPRGVRGEALEAHVQRRLDPRNVDHILAAMEHGLVTHAIALARSAPRGAVEADAWTDGHGVRHELLRAPTVDAVSAEFGRPSASLAGQRAHRLLSEATHVVLDVDLDCFTTLSDADPTTVLPWPEELVRQHLMPRGSEDFWSLLLSKCSVLTVAREPLHCGGLLASGRLLESFARVMFGDLLQTDVP